MPPRILIVTASVGEGHDAPARALAEQLRAERPDAEIATEDCLAVMGSAVSAVSEGAARVVFYRFLWMWDVAFWLFAALRADPRAHPAGAHALRLARAARADRRPRPRRRSSRSIRTRPRCSAACARAGRLQVPVCAAITDVAGLRYWATPGADLHLVTHPESIEEVRAIAGADARGALRPRLHQGRVPRTPFAGAQARRRSASTRRRRSCSSRAAAGGSARSRRR